MIIGAENCWCNVNGSSECYFFECEVFQLLSVWPLCSIYRAAIIFLFYFLRLKKSLMRIVIWKVLYHIELGMLDVSVAIYQEGLIGFELKWPNRSRTVRIIILTHTDDLFEILALYFFIAPFITKDVFILTFNLNKQYRLQNV